MREIQFRAWDKRVKRFVDFDGMYFEKNSFDMLVHKHKQTIKDHIILNQYTGIHGKNGVEIYEGDIVNFELEIDNFVNAYIHFSITDGMYLVHYIDDDFDEAFGNWASISHFEVIGNIYENPELLEAQNVNN